MTRVVRKTQTTNRNVDVLRLLQNDVRGVDNCFRWPPGVTRTESLCVDGYKKALAWGEVSRVVGWSGEFGKSPYGISKIERWNLDVLSDRSDFTYRLIGSILGGG